tara:strand:- start:655 stop:1020 length:366 start_codon:yes stop_codon:yes gene_type:complete
MKRLILLFLLLAFPAAADNSFLFPLTGHSVSATTGSTVNMANDTLTAKYIRIIADEDSFIAFGATSGCGGCDRGPPFASNTTGHFLKADVWTPPLKIIGETYWSVRASDTGGMIYIQEYTN